MVPSTPRGRRRQAWTTQAREQDLEGIVAKWKRGIYAEPSSWIKIKNRMHTGARDRHELMS
jgi:ATP-dependent DNA ligase